jgi:hypothetical protein
VPLPAPIPAPPTAPPTAAVPVAVAADVLVTDEHGNQYRLLVQDQPVLGKGVQCTHDQIYFMQNSLILS